MACANDSRPPWRNSDHLVGDLVGASCVLVQRVLGGGCRRRAPDSEGRSKPRAARHKLSKMKSMVSFEASSANVEVSSEGAARRSRQRRHPRR